jgi:hypothetical protein
MTLCPLEFMTIKFKGNQFTGKISPTFREIIERGTQEAGILTEEEFQAEKARILTS